MHHGRTPDAILITGGRVFLDGHVQEAPVALVDGKIAAIGGDAVDALATTPSETIDAAGGLVVAGFQDSHIHPHHAGNTLVTCDLSEEDSIEGYLDRIAAYAAAHPEREWITGGGWGMDQFPSGIPTKELLDRVVPDRPVYLPNRDGHGAWVNSRALELAGVTRDTIDPISGRIERDADGEPIGCLQEGAMELVSAHVPPLGDDLVDEGFLLAQQQLFAWGVTAWQDAMVESGDRGLDNLASYRRLDADGRLLARVVGAQWWEREKGLDQIEAFVAQRDAVTGERFSAGSVKIMQDGVAENFTAAMLEPYLDGCGCSTQNTGKSFVEPGMLTEASAALTAAGLRVHFHTLGDRAVREALDAIESTPGMVRPLLAHLQVIHPDDIARFAPLDAVASIQPLWARHESQMDELTIPFLGATRSAWQYPFASLRRAGATLALGSDWPVSTANPLEIIHTAVTRCPPGLSANPLGGEQAISLSDAVVGYTEGSAYANADEHRTGRIAVGYDADVTILDRDIFSASTAEIADASVAYTIVGGRVVFEAPTTGGNA
ncbi:amidohydrolase [Labedella phragmitis]|uniref:Amidohydrolase n=1 Tax=Labedella phragmitis TaxID=2498849 RepID=A0A3S4BII3_9MICO|nr:amidohydrolase [Labedella phragmitis]RWZ50919.1 amidohydrolase [Labedella phragmitis]